MLWTRIHPDQRHRRAARRPDHCRLRGQPLAHRSARLAAARLLHAQGPADFLAARRREHTAVGHTTAWGIFGPPHSVVCVTSFPPDLDADGDAVTVRAAGKKITVPVAALPVLQVLLSGHPVDPGDVDMDTTTLAAVLTQAGICTELTPALAAGYADMLVTGSEFTQASTGAIGVDKSRCARAERNDGLFIPDMTGEPVTSRSGL